LVLDTLENDIFLSTKIEEYFLQELKESFGQQEKEYRILFYERTSLVYNTVPKQR
jgi:hypothetical protein